MQSVLFSTFICLMLLSCHSPNKPLGGIPPEKVLATFELPEGFNIELVAAEPMVADPVAMEVDEFGNIYVLEMHGYPLDKSGSGVVKFLTDTNGDGFPDKFTVFADKLTLPSGIMRWKKGILIVDVPDVIYLEDTNGDGIADIRKIVLTGFALSNPQHNANTPLYGLDNWVYIAHEGEITPKIYTKEFGDSGSIIHFPDKPTATTLPRNANNRNVRFKPGQYQLEMLSGETQYGQTFDPLGHHFLTSNANHIFHEAIQARYLDQNPNLLVADATQDIPDHGNAAEVFPITKNPQHQLLTDVGVITSSCGITWYQGGLFPDSFNNVTFVAEPVHNLVHADKISPTGASYSASRLYPDKEFLASTDPWFRPVQFYIGPDGALYVIDYYRQIIEHPEWMSEEVARSGALYNGSNQGRIYRITPKNSAPLNWNSRINAKEPTTAEWVKHLSDNNIWWRRNAQRLLVDKQDPSSIPLINALLDTSNSPVAIVHGLWTLEGLNGTNESQLLKFLDHSNAGVRENAIRISELHIIEMNGLVSKLVTMYTDDDDKVRYQLLCTLGLLKTNAAETARQKILQQDIDDKWVQIAALAASPGQEWALMEAAKKNLDNQASEGRALFYNNTGAVIGLSGNQNDIKRLVQTTSTNVKPSDVWWKAALQEGLLKGLSVKGIPEGTWTSEVDVLLTLFKPETPALLRRSGLHLLSVFDPKGIAPKSPMLKNARAVFTDRQADVAYREDAIVLVSMLSDPSNEKLFQNLIQPNEPENLQKIAVRTLIRQSGKKACMFVIESWTKLTPGVRDEAMDQFLQSTDNMQALLDAVERGQIQASTIGWHRMVDLMNNNDNTIRERSRHLLASVTENRDEAYKKFIPAINISGDTGNGSAIFQKNCAICHQLNGQAGKAFGPDLASIRNREAQFIMADIINPNRSIADGYENWTMVLHNGKKQRGIISSENAASITLKETGGMENIIPRSEIKFLEADKTSAMPPGMESNMSLQQMADLLAYLKKGK